MPALRSADHPHGPKHHQHAPAGPLSSPDQGPWVLGTGYWVLRPRTMPMPSPLLPSKLPLPSSMMSASLTHVTCHQTAPASTPHASTPCSSSALHSDNGRRSPSAQRNRPAPQSAKARPRTAPNQDRRVVTPMLPATNVPDGSQSSHRGESRGMTALVRASLRNLLLRHRNHSRNDEASVRTHLLAADISDATIRAGRAGPNRKPQIPQARSGRRSSQQLHARPGCSPKPQAWVRPAGHSGGPTGGPAGGLAGGPARGPAGQAGRRAQYARPGTPRQAAASRGNPANAGQAVYAGSHAACP